MLVFKQGKWGAAGFLAALAIWLVQAAADVQVGRDFQANEAVETIRVEIAVGAGGEDLDEPLALDLGLGFPLWLHRLGRVESTAAPFGAVSQRGTAAHAIRAGERATFEFAASGETGLDELRTTPQLLAGVRVSDISRVGFTSPANHGWILAGYTIQINGKPFASNSAVNANGRGRQDESRERLTELNRELGPQQGELTDLQALVAAGLAADADRTRLADLERTLGPQLAEVRRLERQLRGAAPFFSESGFRSAWRTNGAIERLKVTVISAPHTGASTRNYIYFRTGGHKYLLGSAAQPLSPDFGPQEFELDLATAPLTAGDLRGYALGMLAPHEPAGDAPDRWHPQRLRIEIDGRVVYDSEDNSIDQASLSAIRLVPPAHINAAGQVVANTPIAREAFAWEAGSGAGLDLVHGGAEALPAEDDPTYPDPEPSVAIDQDIDVNVAIQDADTWYDPAAGPFPGEAGFGPGWQPGWGPLPDAGWGPGWGPGGWGPPGWDPGWGPGWVPGPSWLDLLLYGLLDELGVLPDWVIPDPVGEPPQLEEVQYNVGTHTVHWTVTGDESQIDHFVVDIVLIRPDLGAPIVQSITEPIEVGADQRILASPAWTPLVVPFAFENQSRSYAAVRVVIVPTDPALGTDPGLAPASPVMPTVHPLHIAPAPDATFVPAVGPASIVPLALGGEPEIPGAAAWIGGQCDSHNGLVFGGFSPMQYHVGVRPVANGDRLVVRFNGHVEGRHRLIAFLGFRGALVAPADVAVDAACFVANAGGNHTYHSDAHLVSDPAFAPTPLLPVIVDIDTAADIGPGVMEFNASYAIRCNNVDPNHPPMLIGVRLFPRP
jgi:hypothetical protein